MPLTAKQERFCREYMLDLNVTAAAKRAGYSERSARQVGALNMTKHDIVARIAELQGAVAEKLDITAERIARELALLGFANMGDYMRAGPDGDPVLDFSDLTRDQMAALTEVTVEDFKDGRGEEARDVRRVKFKLADKRSALETLGRHLGMFVDRSLNMNVDLDKLTDHELDDRIAGVERRIAQLAGGGTSPEGREGAPTRH